MSFSPRQPSEKFSISFDFTAVLQAAETISSATITVVDTSTLADVTNTILDATKQSIIGKVVSGYVNGGGTSGHNYLITCKAVGSLDSQPELEGVLPIAETPADTEELGTGPTLDSLLAEIDDIIQDAAFTREKLTEKINDAVSSIAAGIRMPDQSISPPLPDLYKSSTVATTTLAYASLPNDYQRNLFIVADSAGNKISPPRGGDYYAFALFMRQINSPNMAEVGSVYRVAVKGRKLYYQGIPATAENLWIHYYRKPVPMVSGSDEPDGIPEHLQKRLIKHYVCKEILGESIEDGQDNRGIGTKYHTAKFFEAMTDLCDFIGIDATPQYYGGDYEDDGACD